MTETIKHSGAALTEATMESHDEHTAWDEPVICRVEVDLPGWLAKLTGQPHWEVFGEDEAENCISFSMRAKLQPRTAQDTAMQAEVTLYHNGYAIVDVDGQSLFDGALTAATHDCARLSYYHISGEPIALN